MRTHLITVFICLSLALLGSSCAVVMNGPTDKITLRSTEPDVKVKVPQVTDEVLTLPAKIEVPRKKEVITVTVMSGEVTSEIYILPHRSDWVIGNVALYYFIPVGLLVDLTNSQSYNYKGTYNFAPKYGKWYDEDVKHWDFLPKLTMELGFPTLSHNAHPTAYGYIYSANLFGIEGMMRFAVSDKSFIRGGVGIISRNVLGNGDATNVDGVRTRSRNHYWIAEYGYMYNKKIAWSVGLQATRYNHLINNGNDWFFNDYALHSSFWQFGTTFGIELFPNTHSIQLRYSPSFYSAENYINSTAANPLYTGNGFRYAHTISLAFKLKANAMY